MASALAAQLYTVRDFLSTPQDIAASLKKVADIGYAAVELAGLGPIEPSELRSICEGEGLSICASHDGYYELRDEAEATIERHLAQGCHFGVVGVPDEYRNAEGYSRFAQEASKVAARLAESGIGFAYHNHSFEFVKFGDRTGLQMLYEDSDPAYLKAELDTYWVQHGGASPVVWIEQLAGRVPLLHLKDMAIVDEHRIYAEVGEGNMDWAGILAAARHAGVRWYIVEQDTCRRDPFESLQISYRNLRAMGLE